MPKPTSIRFIQEDNTFACGGCFERVEIPRRIQNGFDFTAAKEAMEHAHEAKGCVKAMERLEAASSRRAPGNTIFGLKLA